MKTYTVYLSTQSTIRPPLVKTNLAQVKWVMNWREIFNGRTGKCRVRAKLISNLNASITWNNANGSLRATFASNTSNSTNGFNLGNISQVLMADAPNSNRCLICDTTSSQGSTIEIPTGNGDFVVSLLKADDTLMTDVAEYQLYLYFDVDDELPYFKDKPELDIYKAI